MKERHHDRLDGQQDPHDEAAVKDRSGSRRDFGKRKSRGERADDHSDGCDCRVKKAIAKEDAKIAQAPGLGVVDKDPRGRQPQSVELKGLGRLKRTDDDPVDWVDRHDVQKRSSRCTRAVRAIGLISRLSILVTPKPSSGQPDDADQDQADHDHKGRDGVGEGKVGSASKGGVVHVDSPTPTSGGRDCLRSSQR